MFGSTYVVSVWWPRVARALRKRGGGGEGEQVAKIFVQVGMQNYYGSQFTSLRQVLIMGPSPVPGAEGDWGDDLCR